MRWPLKLGWSSQPPAYNHLTYDVPFVIMELQSIQALAMRTPLVQITLSLPSQINSVFVNMHYSSSVQFSLPFRQETNTVHSTDIKKLHPQLLTMYPVLEIWLDSNQPEYYWDQGWINNNGWVHWAKIGLSSKFVSVQLARTKSSSSNGLTVSRCWQTRRLESVLRQWAGGSPGLVESLYPPEAPSRPGPQQRLHDIQHCVLQDTQDNGQTGKVQLWGKYIHIVLLLTCYFAPIAVEFCIYCQTLIIQKPC